MEPKKKIGPKKPRRVKKKWTLEKKSGKKNTKKNIYGFYGTLLG